MKRSTFNYIKQILKEYPQINNHIKRRTEELQYPHRPDDVNAGIRGNKQSDAMANLMVTVEQDRRLSALERNKKVIEDNLNACGEDTETIIRELYLKRYPRYTMDGLIVQGKISCKRSKAYELRNQFFENVSEDLNLL